MMNAMTSGRKAGFLHLSLFLVAGNQAASAGVYGA